jgi:hypothetical protein
MKTAPNLNFTVVKPEQKSLDSFVQMIKNVYQNFSQVVNGSLGFGDGTNPDNISGSWINVTAPVAPNTDFTVNHNLGRIPVGYWAMQKDRACDVYTGSIAATSTALTLRATVASAVLRLFIIGLVLSILPLRSNAQGSNHFNTAFKTVIAAGSTGIGGPVLQPIAGAVITVCSGTTLPLPGSVCAGAATIYSNPSLTTVLSNPTNADSNGNYTFWATGGNNYVISVSGIGVTTYSYVWTAPLTTVVTGAPLNGNNVFTGNNTFTNVITGSITGSAGSATNATTATNVSGGGTVSAKQINNTRYADQFIGATADVQLNAACAALPVGGGIIDATGYGAGFQSIAATVTCGSNSKYVKFVFDPSTIFQPATSSVVMFQVSNKNWFQGLSIDTTNQVTFTGKTITNNPSMGTALTSFRIDHTNVNMTGGLGAGSCLAWVSNGINAGVQYGEVNDFTCSGNINSSAILMQNSVDGYINNVHYRAINCYNMKYCIDMEQGGIGAISTNIFSDLSCEHSSLAGSLACVNMNATGVTNLIFSNQFYMAAWDLQGANKAVIISNSKVCGNIVIGYLNSYTDSTTTCGTTGNTFIDLTGQSPSGYIFGQIPSMNITSKLAIGLGATSGLISSGAGGVVASSPSCSNSTDGCHVEAKRVVGCATGAVLGNTCDVTVTWNTPFVNTSYTAWCSGAGITSGLPLVEGINISGAQTAAAITVRTVNTTAAAAQFTALNCGAIHD